MGEDGATAAELFERGRFSETLTAYTEASHPSELEAPSHRAVYAACNRAAAKLGLEMFRACIRDLDDAITQDAFCLRAYLLKGRYRPGSSIQSLIHYAMYCCAWGEMLMLPA